MYRLFLKIDTCTYYSQKSVCVRIIPKNLYRLICKCSLAVHICNCHPRNILLMRRQNTNIAWNGMMLLCYTMTLRCYLSTLVHNGFTLHVCTDLYNSTLLPSALESQLSSSSSYCYDCKTYVNVLHFSLFPSRS